MRRQNSHCGIECHDSEEVLGWGNVGDSREEDGEMDGVIGGEVSEGYSGEVLGSWVEWVDVEGVGL